MIGVAAVVVSRNPDLFRFKSVLDSIINRVKHVVIVDNNSDNKSFIKDLCNKLNKCSFIEVGFNSGIAYALMKGVHYVVNNYGLEWLLFLDDDTILLENAVNKVLSAYNGLPKFVKDRVGLIKLSIWNGDCRIYEILYGAFSGTLIKSDVALRTCCRVNFFLDQADHDLYARVRELGYLTLMMNCRLIDHRLGTEIRTPVLSKILRRRAILYEPPWRYYYIVRNSTILLREGRIDFYFYARQLLWGLRILYRDGIRKFVKPLGLGLAHALLNNEGFIDNKYFI